MATLSIVHRYQSESFEKAKCVHKYGSQTYTFTGEPFETPYDRYSCVDLCYAKITYELCGCGNVVGWNLTKTDCLHEQRNRDCLLRTDHNFTELEQKVVGCSSKCLPKCNQKYFETQVWRKQRKWTNYTFQTVLQLIARSEEKEFSKAKRLLQVYENFSHDGEEVPKITASMSHVFIRLKNEPVKVVEIIPLVTFSTFISNVGGILGMCLGLSAVSVYEILQKLLLHILVPSKSKRIKNIEHERENSVNEDMKDEKISDGGSV